MDRNVQIITDLDGKKLVIINDIIFKGKQHIKWDDVENYLKNYIGDFFEIAETSDPRRMLPGNSRVNKSCT